MKLVINESQEFKKDLHKFKSQEKNKTISKIITACELFKTNHNEFTRKLFRPRRIELTNGFQPSLYAIKIDQGNRVLVTVDEDPIFHQILITLLRIVKPDQLKTAFDSSVHQLYKDFLSQKIS